MHSSLVGSFPFDAAAVKAMRVRARAEKDRHDGKGHFGLSISSAVVDCGEMRTWAEHVKGMLNSVMVYENVLCLLVNK